MENPLRWKIVAQQGKKMHEGVHALIQREQKILLVQRRFPPFGWGLVSGHVEKGEDPEAGLTREVREEIRAQAGNVKFLISMLDTQGCFLYQHWTHVYSCAIEREPVLNYELKNFGWFTPEKIAHLNLTKITRQIFEQLLII